MQYIGPATWCNANTIAPSLAYIRGSLLDNRVFYQPEPSRQVVNWVSTTLVAAVDTRQVATRASGKIKDQVARSSGKIKWQDQVARSSGKIKWQDQVARSSGKIKWQDQVTGARQYFLRRGRELSYCVLLRRPVKP